MRTKIRLYAFEKIFIISSNYKRNLISPSEVKTEFSAESGIQKFKFYSFFQFFNR